MAPLVFGSDKSVGIDSTRLWLVLMGKSRKAQNLLLLQFEVGAVVKSKNSVLNNTLN